MRWRVGARRLRQSHRIDGMSGVKGKSGNQLQKNHKFVRTQDGFQCEDDHYFYLLKSILAKSELDIGFASPAAFAAVPAVVDPFSLLTGKVCRCRERGSNES